MRVWGARDTAAVPTGSCLCSKWHFPNKSVWSSQVSACLTQLFSTIFCLPNAAAQQGWSEAAQKLKTKNAFQALGKQAVQRGGKHTVRKTFRLKIITPGTVGFIGCRKKPTPGSPQLAKDQGGFQLRNTTRISEKQKCLSEM